MKETTGKYRVLGIYLLLAGLSFAVYKPVLHYQFVNFDDDVYVTANQYVKAGLTRESIIWAFAAPHLNFWHPLTMLSHMLDCTLFGLKPWGHHLSSLLLHIANTLTLFLVLKTMTGAVWRSAFVAAAFALHPLHVESAAWISERKDVLSALFFMLTIAAYLRYVRQRGIKWYLLTFLLFVMGLMAKPMLVTLPFVLLLLDYWPLKRINSKLSNIGKLTLEKLPFFVLSAIASIIAFSAQQSAGALAKIDVVPLKIRIANAFVSYLAYLWKMIWPSRLAVYYPHPGNSLSMRQAVIAAVILLIIFFYVVRLAKRYGYLLTGWLWYVGTLFPVIGLVQVGFFAMADRYTYLPSIGIFIMIAWGISEVSAKWRFREIILSVSSIAVLSAFSVCTYFQLRYWQNSVTLFEHALKVTGNNFLAYNNLGFACLELGRYNEAIENCKQAVRIKPNYARAYYNLSVAYDRLGRWQDMMEACQQAIRIKPDYAKAYCNLGIAYGQLGRYQDKMEACKQAIKINPDYAEAYNNLGVAYVKVGSPEKAMEAFKQAVKTKPDFAEAHYNLGMAYLTNGDSGSASGEYEILKILDAGMAEKLFRMIHK